MELYKKKIRDYKKLIQEEYVEDTAIKDVVKQCEGVLLRAESSRISCYEFIYHQSKFIKKKWWILQGGVLIVLWFLLKDASGVGEVEQRLGSMAAFFAILVIPEFWKNRTYSAVEIERASLYSLPHICGARILLFALVDLLMVTAFFVITSSTTQISIYKMIINFLLPFNVSVCICFRLLYSKWGEMEYVAVLLGMVWIVLWSVIVTQEAIYQMIAEPVWIGLLLLSFGYLFFCVRKSQLHWEMVWKENIHGIKA